MRLCSILTKTWTLLVVQHKTTHHQGPAEIVPRTRRCTGGWPSLWNTSGLNLPTRMKDHLFVKDNGLAFTPETIGKRVTAIFKMVGMRPNNSITETSIRRDVLLFHVWPASGEEAACAPPHGNSKATVDKNDVLQVKAERSARAYSLLKNIRK